MRLTRPKVLLVQGVGGCTFVEVKHRHCRRNAGRGQRRGEQRVRLDVVVGFQNNNAKTFGGKNQWCQGGGRGREQQCMDLLVLVVGGSWRWLVVVVTGGGR
jgi:hypothetical protein